QAAADTAAAQADRAADAAADATDAATDEMADAAADAAEDAADAAEDAADIADEAADASEDAAEGEVRHSAGASSLHLETDRGPPGNRRSFFLLRRALHRHGPTLRASTKRGPDHEQPNRAAARRRRHCPGGLRERPGFKPRGRRGRRRRGTRPRIRRRS